MVNVSDRTKVDWHGKWIWPDIFTPKRIEFADRSSEYRPLQRSEWNRWIFARRKFFVQRMPQKATLFITADSRYKVFINGRYIGRGINRCEAYYWYYNRYDVRTFLKSGENVIAVHARFYGIETAYYTPPEQSGRNKENCGKGGLLFEIGLMYEPSDNLPTQWIGSDLDTKVIEDIAERSDTPLKNDALGFLEEIDSRKCSQNWNEVDFDDSTWKKPIILDYPAKTLIFDYNAPLHEELVFASKILLIGEVDDITSSEDFDAEDLKEMDFNICNHMESDPQPLNQIKVINPTVFTGTQGVCEITSSNSHKSFALMIQFPREIVGYPRIVIDGPAGTIIDIIPSEKINQGRIGLGFSGSKRGSRLFLRGGKQFFEQWDWEGFLFIQIKVRNITGPVKIYHFSANCTHMQTPRKGKFECSDPKLTQLWEACAHTLRCCAIDGYLDCPSREQRSYLGDAYPEAMVAIACFGEPRLTKKIIYDTAFGQRKDGITFSFHPGDYTLQCHIIPDYCLYWMQITAEYYQYFGDEKVLEDLYPHFIRALDWFMKYLDPVMDLLRPELPYWMFIDWSYPHQKPGYNAIINTQFMDCLRFVGTIGQKLGDQRISTKYLHYAEIMRRKIDKLFWDPQENCYKDYWLDNKLYNISQHTNCYLILKGVASKEKQTLIMDKIFNPKAEKNALNQIQLMQKKNQSHHNLHKIAENQILIAQPFFMHHVNRVLAQHTRYDIMMRYFQNAWEPMLEMGETGTIWETWAKEGSECHAWSATPAYDLSTNWLGVKPIAPGFTNLEISPTFYGLTWVDGIFPTCKGDIHVIWKRKNSQITLSIEISNRIPQASLIIPSLEGKNPQRIETTNLPIPNMLFQYQLQSGTNEFEIFF